MLTVASMPSAFPLSSVASDVQPVRLRIILSYLWMPVMYRPEKSLNLKLGPIPQTFLPNSDLQIRNMCPKLCALEQGIIACDICNSLTTWLKTFPTILSLSPGY